VRCELQWQACVLHSHSAVSRVVVETTWEVAEHNTGLERTKPHVFRQDKWPAGSYTTRVASGRGFLLLILLYSIPSPPLPASLSTCIKIMAHQDTWQAVTWSILSHEAPWEDALEVVLSPPLLFCHSGNFFFSLFSYDNFFHERSVLQDSLKCNSLWCACIIRSCCHFAVIFVFGRESVPRVEWSASGSAASA